MSNPLYFFDVDDIAFGGDTAILARDGQRILVKNLSRENVEWLDSVSNARPFRLEEIPAEMHSQIEKFEIVRPVELTPRRRRGRGIQLPSRWVRMLARPLAPLTHFRTHSFIIIGVLSLLHEKILALEPVHAIQDWIASMSPMFALVASATFLVSSIAHELGHAAACFRVTGMTGAIRFATYRGLPALAADVSSVCLADAKGRAAVAISGPMLQIAFAAFILAFGNEPMRFGATLAMLSAIFAATPLPLTDGYWLLRDLTGLHLVPRLILSKAHSKISDVVYGWGLIAMTIFFTVLLSYECVQMARQAAPLASTSVTRGAMLTGMTGYLAFVIVLFVFGNIKLFFRK